MFHSFTAYLQQFEREDLWHYHLQVPDEVALALKSGGTRVICTLNHTYSFQCAVMSAGEKGYFININKEIRERLHLKLHDEIRVHLIPDPSKYGMPVPEVFAELWQQDPEFDEVFHALSPGKQRTLLHMIGKYKSETKQLEKLLILRHYLVGVGGKLDFKELNEAFKKGSKS